MVFVINQVCGTLLVQPDWDAYFQISIRFATLGALGYWQEISDIVGQFEGFTA